MCWEKEGLWDTIADCLESAHGYIDLVFTLAVRLSLEQFICFAMVS